MVLRYYVTVTDRINIRVLRGRDSTGDKMDAFVSRTPYAHAVRAPAVEITGQLSRAFFKTEKAAVGKKKLTSPVWAEVFELTDEGVAHFAELRHITASKDNFTHVCLCANKDSIECCTPLKMASVKGKPGYYCTSPAIEHIRQKHTQHPIAQLSFKRQDMKQETVANSMAATAGGLPRAGADSATSLTPTSLTQSTLAAFVLSPADKSRAAQARYYIESSSRISKNTFEDKAFIQLLKIHGGDDFFKLSPRELINYVRAESKILTGMIKHVLVLKQAQALGNQFAQLQHDGGTSKNGIKHQAFAVSVVDPKFDFPMVIAIDVVTLAIYDNGRMVLEKHTDENVSKALKASWAKLCSAPLTEVRAARPSR